MVPFPSVQASDGAFFGTLGLVAFVALIGWPRPRPGQSSSAGSSGLAGPAVGGARGSLWFVLLGAVAALGGTLQIRSVDIFWHLATGRWILSHGAVPRHDPFRFSSLQVPWVDHEWLFQLVLAVVEGLGGLEMLVVARALFLVGLILFLAWALRRTLAPCLRWRSSRQSPSSWSGDGSSSRPEIVTVAGLVFVLALLQEHRRKGGSVGAIMGLCVVVALWSNGHPGVVIVPGVAAAFLVGCRLPGGSGTPARGTEARTWKELVGVPLVVAAAALANPYGIEVFFASQKILAAFRGLDAVNPDWANAWDAPRPFFFVATGALAVYTVVAWRRGARLDPATGLVVLLLLPLGLAGVRHQPLVAIAASFFARRDRGWLAPWKGIAELVASCCYRNGGGRVHHGSLVVGSLSSHRAL